MNPRPSAFIVCLLAAAVLAIAPFLGGCGRNGGKATGDIVIGFIGDLTGPGAFAVKQTLDGQADYIRMLNEEELVPGVYVKYITYDSRGDRGRVQPAYKWLRGQGADLICTISGDEAAILMPTLEADHIAAFTANSSQSLYASEWAFGVLPPPIAQGETIAHWMEEHWDPNQGVAKVGLIGLGPLTISREILESIQEWCAATPGFVLAAGELVPYGTVTWAAEIAHLRDCDFIVNTAIGSSMATFERDISASGWQGTHVGCMESFMAFWTLVRTAVSPDDLDGAIASDPGAHWNDNVPFINQCKEYTEKYRPSEAEEIFAAVGRIPGWCAGYIIAAAIEKAVVAVGVENVDSQAIRDALVGTDIDVEGFGNPWRLTGDLPCFWQTVRMMKWDAQGAEWQACSDWYRPPSMGG